MKSVKHTELYKEALIELNYDYADVFVYEGFVIVEFAEGLVFNWDDYGQTMVKDVCDYLDTNGGDLVYISHRINNYSVKATDWMKLYSLNYDVRANAVVGYKPNSFLTTVIENLFLKNKIKRFNSLIDAVNWVKQLVKEEKEENV
ncbi:hypothetical protein [Pontimicrobium sp. IMCC45349]|uniref:hypothetical protein n=1 Tax=Pontimicrobium sp. IMCC45349 TaxID=3391574 RepID=UPI0039A1D702